MTDTTTRPRPFHEVAPFPDANPTVEAMRTHFAAMALAHYNAWYAGTRAFTRTYGQPPEVREAAAQVMQAAHAAHEAPMVAAWTAASLLAGWDAIVSAEVGVDDQQCMVEHLWQWLHEAGIDPESITLPTPTQED